MLTCSVRCQRASRQLFASSSTNPFVQTRSYASQPKKGQVVKQASQGFKGKKGALPGQAEPAKKDKKMAFQPLPVSQLPHPLFESDRPDTLSLQSFHPEMLTRIVESQALKFPHNDNDPFRIFGLPRNILVEYRLLSKPCSVIRSVTIDAINKLDAASEKESWQSRVIFTGPQGCGKSFLLLQAMQYCNARDWLVLYIPRATSLVNSTTAHVYDMRTRTYLQPVFAYQTLQRFLKVNAPKLEQLRTQTDLEIERRPAVPADTPLVELINIGLKDQGLAPTVLSAVLEVIGKQTTFPMLLAIDDFQALYGKSHYRDQHFSAIKSYHLSMPRLLLEYASGRKSFARGAVFGALSMSNTTFPLPLELCEALSLEYDRPYGPYVKRSSELVKYTHRLEKLAVPNSLTIPEAASVFDVWMKDRAVPTKPNDELFLSKYSEASGNARAFVWKGLLSSIST
ncbi:hypothetical protein K503DRAFT_718053 [Rhizopogon vinicolor AM-OR11-026]|uniref:Small ribosomal subunit protein mS29 n=1 Tax=Rhizopogon vinicolor AM-OR11-026 TaxID=1314800 RepID=A0A1B7N137_9AGAM|nr:hypothetical protein K503DRAFT_718053 [Rhizopogon vinicolor AM-OR11-026]